MIAKQNSEFLENSSVKLTLTVEQEAVKKEYDDLVKKYTKTISLKGFRKGKVPASILIQKFGSSLKGETTGNVIEKALTEVFSNSDRPPLSYSTPKLEEEVLIDLEKDFTFTVTYDVYPEIKLCKYEGMEIEVPTCSIEKEDVDRELEYLRKQNALIVEKEDGKKAENKDIVTVTYVELDEAGGEIKNTGREDFIFTIGSGYDPYNIEKDLLGMVKGEEKIIERSSPDDDNAEESQKITKQIKVKLTAIKVKELPDLDDELAQDIGDEETLEDLKVTLKKNLTTQAEQRLKDFHGILLLQKIADGSEIPLPQSMLQAALEDSWQNFVNHFGGREAKVLNILKEENREKAQVLEEWKEQKEKAIKSQLVFNELIKKENIEISLEELEEEIKKQAENQGISIEEAKKQMENIQVIGNLREKLSTGKLLEVLFEKTTIKTGQRISFLDLIDQKQ